MSLLKKIYNRSPIPLQNLAVTFEGMRIKNQRYNKNFKKTLLDYLKNDNLPINKIKEIRLLKLKKLLIFANTYSRFYKDLFSQKKFNPENLKSEEEIEILPILGKNEIKAIFNESLSAAAMGLIDDLEFQLDSAKIKDTVPFDSSVPF